MDKAYPHYLLRHVESLNNLWDFSFFEGKSLEEIKVDDLTWEHRLPVPGAFDAFPQFLGKRGTGVYRQTVKVKAGSQAMLEFGAVSMAARVYVDGELLAEHFCGYAPFTVMLPLSEKNEREVIVCAENRYDFDRIPMHQHFFDFYQYGGIIRQVWLHHLPESYLVSVKVDTEDAAAGKIHVRGRASGAGMVSLQVEGLAEKVSAEASAEGEFKASLTIPDPKLWSPDSPHLYRLKAVLENDDTIVRFGLREVKTAGKKVLINGEPIRFFGYNRHEYFPNYGPTTPYSQQVADIQILKGMGCNFVRGSHYPQDQRFLDLCDELGLFVWEENLGWGQSEYQLINPLYQKHHQRSLEEMVERSYNHPSIVIWGFLNEAASELESSRPIYEGTFKYLRENGGNRLVTYASNRPEKDIFLDLVDIICINYYPGWYGCENHPDPLSLVVPAIHDLQEMFKKKGLDNKPFVVSEIGAEGLYGWHDQQRDFHSEEYQHDYLETISREVVDNKEIQGLLLWHFSDARTYSGGLSMRRPRAFNNKGTFDEYRRPKLAYSVVKEIFEGRDS